jgi:hypothetical protein
MTALTIMTLDAVCHNTDFHLNLFKWQSSVIGTTKLNMMTLTIETLDAYADSHF